ncbi:MAG: hypothetical protein AB7K68_11565 [Bacteriovoracia bacterium]
MKTISGSQLRFCILPSANPPAEMKALHDNCFRLWMDVWSETFRKLNFDTSRLVDDFIRQDLIACIADGDMPVAIHLYSFYAADSEAARAHSYLNGNYPELYFARLKKQKVRSLMSMEYLTVHPDWRKGKSNVHFAIVLVGLALKTLRAYGADAAIAPARRDHKVHDLAYAFGGEPVIENVLNHNVACDLLMCHRDRVIPHANPEVNELVNSLWQTRKFYPNYELQPEDNILPLRKAA